VAVDPRTLQLGVVTLDPAPVATDARGADAAARSASRTEDPYGTLAALGLERAVPPEARVVRLHPDAELVSAGMGSDVASPGDAIVVHLLWRAVADAERTSTGARADALPAIALVQEDRVLAVGEGPTVFDTYPPKAWQAGQEVLDRRRLTVPAHADAGPAEIVLRTDAATALSLGAVEIQAEERLLVAPPTAHDADVAFAGVGRLVGYDLASVGGCRLRIDPPEVAPDGRSLLEVEDPASCRLELTLVWRAEAATDTGLKVFTHLLDEDGRLIAQHDSVPAEGRRPTTGWRQGEHIVDAHPLAFVLENVDAVTATLSVGLYDPSTMERSATVDGDDRVDLPPPIAIESR
jgi:hypothetical protein